MRVSESFLFLTCCAFGSLYARAQKAVVVTNAASTNALEADIRPIKDPIPLPDYVFWALAVAAALALVLAAWLLVKWRRSRRVSQPRQPAVPPHRRALQRLEAARLRIEEPEPFCTEVSQIIRLYVEERFQLRAPERTTEEFLQELQQTLTFSQAQKPALADFLAQCDLVKFARLQPPRPELENLLGTAIRLVEETASEPELALASGASGRGV